MPLIPEIECRLQIKEVAPKDSIIISFQIENKSSFAVMVLKRGTPLEGLRTNCLIIRADGELIPYDGKLSKRRPPVMEDYIRLEPAQIISSEVDITTAYSIPPNTKLEIMFDETRLHVKAAGDILKIYGLQEIKGQELNITSLGTAMTTPETFFNTTEGEIVRASEVEKPEFLDKIGVSKFLKNIGLARRLNDPEMSGGNPSQHEKVLKAHKEAYQMIKRSIKELQNANKKHFIKWFDDDPDEETHSTVLETYRKIQKGMEERRFTYSFSLHECDEDTFAWTYMGHRTIWICNNFWTLEHKGMSSRSGTLVHEHGHSTAYLDDHEYGEEGCMDLARRYPGKAVNNAENYEFYAEGME